MALRLPTACTSYNLFSARMVTKVMDKYPDGVLLDSLCLELDMTATHGAFHQNKYPTCVEFNHR